MYPPEHLRVGGVASNVSQIFALLSVTCFAVCLPAYMWVFPVCLSSVCLTVCLLTACHVLAFLPACLSCLSVFLLFISLCPYYCTCHVLACLPFAFLPVLFLFLKRNSQWPRWGLSGGVCCTQVCSTPHLVSNSLSPYRCESPVQLWVF
jgi:hypothetical protein